MTVFAEDEEGGVEDCVVAGVVVVGGRVSSSVGFGKESANSFWNFTPLLESAGFAAAGIVGFVSDSAGRLKEILPLGVGVEAAGGVVAVEGVNEVNLVIGDEGTEGDSVVVAGEKGVEEIIEEGVEGVADIGGILTKAGAAVVLVLVVGPVVVELGPKIEADRSTGLGAKAESEFAVDAGGFMSSPEGFWG